MKCTKCEGKVMQISGKCSDMCNIQIPNSSVKEWDYYVPEIEWLGGGGDYLAIEVCLTCGWIQNFQPLTEAEVVQIYAKDGM